MFQSNAQFEPILINSAVNTFSIHRDKLFVSALEDFRSPTTEMIEWFSSAFEFANESDITSVHAERCLTNALVTNWIYPSIGPSTEM